VPLSFKRIVTLIAALSALQTVIAVTRRCVEDAGAARISTAPAPFVFDAAMLCVVVDALLSM
jgi:hypothetical protein